eukprot:CAMPEP_0184490628 /NCGR_PEP_ID=MMETSP0113_2-20130426/18406_1 /TAXON_ID=91329 /ORGANISM="Norrisiella sphaerica, Strain BC52" /LENGTH=207 /DNA_ID=CAMNT_0026874601 /DNA_START=42 /DNA_END=665 /DNA_ORIENTATION=-
MSCENSKMSNGMFTANCSKNGVKKCKECLHTFCDYHLKVNNSTSLFAKGGHVCKDKKSEAYQEWADGVQHVDCVLEPIIMCKQQEGATFKNKTKVTTGVSIKTDEKSKVSKWAGEASLKVSWTGQTSGKANLGWSAEARSVCRSASMATHTETVEEKEWNIDLSKSGFCLYQGVMHITLNDGRVVQMRGKSTFTAPEPLKHTMFRFQ